MSNDDKPFGCSALGCGMRFSTEDHLHVHMKKHEMSLALNLGGPTSSPSNPFLDQTPTPTKFLRNCEEIGLFQELSKNPFEEAFKKAADLPEAVPLPGPHSNDLNTPVPPDPHKLDSLKLDSLVESAKVQTVMTVKDESKDEVIIVEENEVLDLSGRRDINKIAAPQPSSTTSDDDINLVSTSQAADSTVSPAKSMVASPGTETLSQAAAINPKVPASTAQGPQQAYTMQVYLQLPSGQTVPVNIPATISPVVQMAVPAVIPQKVTSTTPNTTVNTASTSSMALKQRLKQTLVASQQNSIPNSVVKANTEPINNIQLSNASPQQPSTSLSVVIPETVSPIDDSPCDSPDLSDSSYSIKRSKRNSGDDGDTDDRRRKFLERNRAAAARCRQKRKTWINNLEHKADELQNTNSRLQSEVNLLRGEVAQLKTLLLAHKDCPITLQQKSQGHLALTTINLVESGASASVPTIASSEVSASQVAAATDVVTMAPGLTVIPVVADPLATSHEQVKK